MMSNTLQVDLITIPWCSMEFLLLLTFQSKMLHFILNCFADLILKHVLHVVKNHFIGCFETYVMIFNVHCVALNHHWLLFNIWCKGSSCCNESSHWFLSSIVMMSKVSHVVTNHLIGCFETSEGAIGPSCCNKCSKTWGTLPSRDFTTSGSMSVFWNLQSKMRLQNKFKI